MLFFSWTRPRPELRQKCYLMALLRNPTGQRVGSKLFAKDVNTLSVRAGRNS